MASPALPSARAARGVEPAIRTRAAMRGFIIVLPWESVPPRRGRASGSRRWTHRGSMSAARRNRVRRCVAESQLGAEAEGLLRQGFLQRRSQHGPMHGLIGGETARDLREVFA